MDGQLKVSLWLVGQVMVSLCLVGQVMVSLLPIQVVTRLPCRARYREIFLMECPGSFLNFAEAQEAEQRCAASVSHPHGVLTPKGKGETPGAQHQHDQYHPH